MQWVALDAQRHPEIGLLFAIPNGGVRNIVVAKKLKAEGVKPGVPDLFLPVPRIARCGHRACDRAGLFVELKRTQHATISPEQERWHQALLNQSYAVRVCRGWEAARVVLIEYLGTGPECQRA